jgi:phage shock protein C
MEKRLMRNTEDQMFMGVAAGIADYLAIDPVIVRLIFVLLTMTQGVGLLLYIVLALIMPTNGATCGQGERV